MTTFAIAYRGSFCFKAVTLIVTEDGYKKIEDIEVGDKVLSFNEDTRNSDYKEVVRLFRNGKLFNTNDEINTYEVVKDWINFRVSKENSNDELDLITCTFEHTFYVLNADSSRNTVAFVGRDEESLLGSLIASRNLKPGDKLLLSNGNYCIIPIIEIEH